MSETKTPHRAASKAGFDNGYWAGSLQAEILVLDLAYALKEIKGQPTIKDLIKLAKRIRRDRKQRL